MSLTAVLACYLKARPGVWMDGREIARVAGAYAWRSRVSDLRRPPFNMRVANRQRHVRRPDGTRYTVSEYRFVEATAAAANTQ